MINTIFAYCPSWEPSHIVGKTVDILLSGVSREELSSEFSDANLRKGSFIVSSNLSSEINFYN